MRERLLIALSTCLSGLLTSVQGLAESGAQLHLGLDSSVYSSTSISGSQQVTTNGVRTEVKLENTVSDVGFPGSTGLTLGALLGDQFDIGMRFGYASHETSAGSNSGSVTVSGYDFDPYLAFVTGSDQAGARVALGILGGIGSASIKTTTVSSTGTGATTTTSSDSSVDSRSYGAFLKIYGYVTDGASIDPGFSVLSTHASTSGVDLSGLSYMLSVGISLWPSRHTPAGSEVRTPKPKREPSASESVTSRNEDVPASARVVQRPKAGIVVLKFGGERTVSFVHDKDNPAQVLVLVRDPSQEEALSTCNQLTLHALNQEPDSVEASWSKAASQGMRFQVLKASLSTDTLRKMVAAPIANAASVPEHWIDVCAQRWKIGEVERERLKEFVESLPAAPATEPGLDTQN